MADAKLAPLSSRRRQEPLLAILDAALSLCREQGYANLTIEGIAARAGVGKQTIYRWWPSKGAVVLDALDRDVAAVLPVPNTGDVVADMRAVITNVNRLLTDDRWGPHIAALIGEAQHDPAVRSAMVERFITPRRAPMMERLQRAQELGHLPRSLDPKATLEIIFGALYHRLLLRTGPLSADYARLVVDLVLTGPSNAPARRRAQRKRG